MKQQPPKTELQSMKSIRVFTDGGSRNTGNYKGGQVKKNGQSSMGFFDSNTSTKL
ncbi:hypothetical protein [Holzapfeliella floricola]|uniref:hypothetical protein n=1 Tax=Holzapfeliella floricola TaxID=679249 RepID=UPI001F5C292C|nr:hypothetical protein [Holzapfeliella floricola]